MTPRKAMVLAAGLGTRLRPLTDRLPKPAMPVCGVAPLRFTLARLAAGGIREVVVNTHWLPEAVHAAVGDASGLGLKVTYSHEPEILGTGGGLRRVSKRFLDGTFLMVNGKLIFDLDVEGAVAHHQAQGALATMVLRPYPAGATYGAVEIDETTAIRRFKGRFEWSGPLVKTMFTGVHVLEPKVLEYLPPAIEVCINEYAYPKMIGGGQPVFGHLQPDAYFSEPSTPGRYLRVLQDLLDGKVPLEGFRRGGADPFAGMEARAAGVWVHPSARVHSGAALEGPCWIGPGVRVGDRARVGPHVALEREAEVQAGATVRRAIVWPETAIRSGEALDRVVATGPHRVRAEGA